MLATARSLRSGWAFMCAIARRPVAFFIADPAAFEAAFTLDQGFMGNPLTDSHFYRLVAQHPP